MGIFICRIEFGSAFFLYTVHLNITCTPIKLCVIFGYSPLKGVSNLLISAGRRRREMTVTLIQNVI